jgi:hypothetical protein
MALTARKSCQVICLGSVGMRHCNRHMCQVAGGGWRAASRLHRLPSARKVTMIAECDLKGWA